MSMENGAELTDAEKQTVVNELYRQYQQASPYPLDGKPSEQKQAYNRLGNVCHEFGMANPADNEAAAARSERSLMISEIVRNVRRDLSDPKATR